MGVGKTAVCRHLYQALPDCAWLDGDWCWMMHPFVVNEENKAMVLHNITALLRSFLSNSSLKTILFDWVLHEQSIWDDLLSRLPLYQKLRAHKLDVTGLSPEQSAQRLLAWLRQRG